MSDVDALPDHLRRPDLRPVQPVPINRDGQRFFALRDPGMYTDQTLVVPPQALPILQQFRGQRPIEDIAQQFRGDVTQFVELARGLDRVGLLWGPTFDDLEAQLRGQIETDGVFPISASAGLADADEPGEVMLDQWFAETEDPELEGTVRGIVAPHLDYERGWPNYAAAYYMLREMPKPDRVVILGTNHFGTGDGVVLTEFGFDTPVGRCTADAEVVRRMVERLGRPAVVDQLDHAGEHSIELQVPWIVRCLGEIPIVAALVPDPLVEMVDEPDNPRVDGTTFTTALREVLDEVGGSTLIVASSDLSHVGPQFGEPRPVDDQRRMDVEQHDRDMLEKFLSGDAEEFISAMRWNRNPTRWCSIGNMSAVLQLLPDAEPELIDYRQACDDQGVALVSSAAIVIQ